MPLYEFKCGECGGINDRIFKMDAKPDHFEGKCSHCNKETTLYSIISATAISYNGVNHASKVPSDFKKRLDQIKQHHPSMQSSI